MVPGYRGSALACFFQVVVVGGNLLIWSQVAPKGAYADDLKYHTEHVWIPWLVYIGILFLATTCTTVGTISLHRGILLAGWITWLITSMFFAMCCFLITFGLLWVIFVDHCGRPCSSSVGSAAFIIVPSVVIWAAFTFPALVFQWRFMTKLSQAQQPQPDEAQSPLLEA